MGVPLTLIWKNKFFKKNLPAYTYSKKVVEDNQTIIIIIFFFAPKEGRSLSAIIQLFLSLSELYNSAHAKKPLGTSVTNQS